MSRTRSVSPTRFARVIRLLAGAAVGSAALCFSLAPSTASAAPQGPWVLPAGDLSSNGRDSYGPQITTAPDGSATAVWRRSNGSNYIIQATTRPPGGASFGTPVDLSVSGQDANSPQITTAPDGTTTAIWYRSNGSNDIIQVATRSPDGSFGAPVDLSAPSQSATEPQITTVPDGSTTAVWRRRNGGDFIIQAATRPPGGSFGTPIDLSAPGQNDPRPQIATAPDGDTTVVWSFYTGSHNVVQATTRPPGGSFVAPVDLSTPGQEALDPQVTAAPDGSATAIWTGFNGISNFTIQAATRPAGGPFGATVELSAAGQSAGKPQIAAAPDGSATAVWTSYNGPNYIIQAATRPPGSSFGAPVDLSAAGQVADIPQITTAPDSSATAVWTSYNGSDLIIQATTRSSGGSFAGPVELSASGQDAFGPQITTAPDGSSTAVWYRSNGSNSIIQSASTARPSALLEVNRQGNGTGKVTSDPGGIDCGVDCAETYPSFTKVTLSTIPSAGSAFTGWSGGGCSGTGTCQVTMLEGQNISAAFEPLPPEARLAGLKITPKSKAVKPGKKVTFKVKVKNTGDATARKLKLCAKGPKKMVKVPKCEISGDLAAGGSKTVKVKMKLKKSAKKGKKAKITFTATAQEGVKNSGKATIKAK